MAYRLEIRKKVLEYINRGHSVYQAADAFGISKSVIYDWQKRKKLAPNLSYTKHSKINKKKLENYIRTTPDAYLREIAEEFGVSLNAISKMLKKLGYLNKKNTKIRRSRQEKKN